MEYIRKIPYILAALMTIIVGGVSYSSGLDPNVIYTRMLISLVIFLCIGFCIRAILLEVQEKIDEKKEKEILEELEKQEEQSQAGSTIDFRIDDLVEPEDSISEDFSPLTVSQVIRTKIKDE